MIGKYAARQAGAVAVVTVLLAQPAAAERWFGSTSASCGTFGECAAHLTVTELLGDSISAYFSRGPQANAPLILTFRVNKPTEGGVPITIELGAHSIALKPGEDVRTRRLKADDVERVAGYEIAPERTAELATAFLAEKEMRVSAPVAGQMLHLTFRLDGLREALRWFDEWQGKRGAVDALIDKGDHAASDAKAPQALPPAAQWPASIARIFKRERCNAALPTFEDMKTGFVATPLPGRAIWGIACEGGNYNLLYVIVAVRNGDPRTARLVRFPVRGERAASVVVNPVWWETAGELRTFDRDRSLGDCGTVARYRFTAAGVTLVDQRRRKDCDDVFIDPWTRWPQVGRQ